MPQIGWFEILIIVVVAILIVGPKDVPIMIKKITTWVSSFKNYFSEIKRDISDIENDVNDETYDESNHTNNIKKKEKNE